MYVLVPARDVARETIRGYNTPEGQEASDFVIGSLSGVLRNQLLYFGLSGFYSFLFMQVLDILDLVAY